MHQQPYKVLQLLQMHQVKQINLITPDLIAANTQKIAYIGNYLTYKPFDINYVNKLQSEATRRAISD